MCWIRHRLPLLIVSWWGSLQWVNPLQPSIRSAGQSFFSLLLCCCSSSGCKMGLQWFPSLSWWFILFSWITSLMIGTFRSSCRVWLVTYQGAFVIIRSILDSLFCILAICDLLAHLYNSIPSVQTGFMIVLYRSTFSRDAGDFLPVTQYKSFTFRSICCLFLAICCAHVSLESKCRPMYFTVGDCGITVLFMCTAGHCSVLSVKWPAQILLH
jgi:hypothetical protein